VGKFQNYKLHEKISTIGIQNIKNIRFVDRLKTKGKKNL
jgi:hypothetical protein